MNPDSMKKFWRLLTDYEALTQQESVAIRHRDIPSLVSAQRLKATIFPVMQNLGDELGLTRTDCPELDNRLTSLSGLESDNLQSLAAARAATQRRIDELSATRQRLSRVRRNYREEPPTGLASMGFVGRG